MFNISPLQFYTVLGLLLFSFLSTPAYANGGVQTTLETDEAPGSLGDIPESDFFEFQDEPLEGPLTLPDWFKLSFLELSNDIIDLKENNKNGLIVYFGQKHCAYCKAHLEHNWQAPFIVAYTRKHFDVIAIDVRGQRPVADINGKIYRTEKEFSVANKTNFTPTLVFYDPDGNETLRLSGYHPPYQFVAALEYVADQHYKNESLKNYLARAASFSEYGNETLNSNDIFSSPPYGLDRSMFASQIPLVVFFEKPRCHACDILHTGPLSNNTILHTMTQLETVQLDMMSSTPVITPAGQKITTQRWAENLNLYYTPTIIFFNENGKEIIRIDSVVGFYRLNNVLHYVLSKGYLEEPNFQVWRQRHKR
ncbi:MAG: thioredoxin fold domain-containing protein [Ectothiorhodospiraceae bacterium]|nr:thioredoxin fold domain-containing protein [Ectothiorhodospiraceae bacterium]